MSLPPVTVPLPSPRGRVLTIVAGGLLALDGVLLLLAGLWSGRNGLLIAGGLSLIGAGLVVAIWRRHQRNLADIAAVHAEMRVEAAAMRELLGRGRTSKD